jgi:hypothetical protein
MYGEAGMNPYWLALSRDWRHSCVRLVWPVLIPASSVEKMAASRQLQPRRKGACWCVSEQRWQIMPESRFTSAAMDGAGGGEWHPRHTESTAVRCGRHRAHSPAARPGLGPFQSSGMSTDTYHECSVSPMQVVSIDVRKCSSLRATASPNSPSCLIRVACSLIACSLLATGWTCCGLDGGGRRHPDVFFAGCDATTIMHASQCQVPAQRGVCELYAWVMRCDGLRVT